MMKAQYLIVLFALLAAPFAASAQQGTVYYDHTVSTEFELPEEVRSMGIEGLDVAIANMPKQRTTRKALVFNESASLLSTVEEDGAPDVARGAEMLISDGPDFEIRMGFSPMNTSGKTGSTFVSFDDETYTQEHTFLDRTFLVSGDAEPIAWKIPGDQRMVLDQLVVKAEAVKDSVAIEAWFAPGIGVPGGPELFGGLPGLILVLSIDDGRETYTAVELDLDTEVAAFERPTKGRKVTRDEYDAIVQEKLDERAKDMGDVRIHRGVESVTVIRGQ